MTRDLADDFNPEWHDDDQEWDQADADPDAYPPGIDPYPPEDFGPEDKPTDQDLITDHPFQPMPGFPDVCGVMVGRLDQPDDWPCGYSRAEHADRGNDSP